MYSLYSETENNDLVRVEAKKSVCLCYCLKSLFAGGTKSERWHRECSLDMQKAGSANILVSIDSLHHTTR